MGYELGWLVSPSAVACALRVMRSRNKCRNSDSGYFTCESTSFALEERWSSYSSACSKNKRDELLRLLCTWDDQASYGRVDGVSDIHRVYAAGGGYNG